MHKIYDVIFLLLGQLSETVSRRSSNSEDSINDPRFAEMTPLNNNGCNGCYQQDVRSDSRSVCQTCKLFCF